MNTICMLRRNLTKTNDKLKQLEKKMRWWDWVFEEKVGREKIVILHTSMVKLDENVEVFLVKKRVLP